MITPGQGKLWEECSFCEKSVRENRAGSVKNFIRDNIDSIPRFTTNHGIFHVFQTLRSRIGSAYPDRCADRLCASTLHLQNTAFCGLYGEQESLGLLLDNPRLHDLDTLEGVSKHFPAYDNPVSPAQHLWLQAYGEGVSELTAFRKLSLWDYVYRYETEFAYAYPRFMTKAKLLEAFAKRGVPCLQGNLVPIFKIGRAMACYPKRPEAEWVATWWLLQKYSARYTLRNELVTHPQKPWRQCILDALQMFQVLGVSPDLRCVIYWIFYMRTHGLLVRQAERAGLLK